MTDIDSQGAVKTEPASSIATAINILTAPAEAFNELRQRPTKIFPLALVLISSTAVMFWYFSIVDFDWFVDDSLSGRNLSEEQIETSREAMLSMSQTTFRLFGVLGGTAGILLISVLQAGYLGLVSALIGDKYRFGHWFSLIVWTGLPYLLAVIGMAVTIFLSPNGQLSAYDLNPLTLANLGMQSSNESVMLVFNSLNLTLLWSLVLIIMAYKQWLESSLLKAIGVVSAPYVLILGIWAYFAFT